MTKQDEDCGLGYHYFHIQMSMATQVEKTLCYDGFAPFDVRRDRTKRPTWKTMSRITKALQRQLDKNSNRNLLHPRIAEILELDPQFLAALEELMEPANQAPATEERIPELVSFAADALIEKIYAVNQYLQIDKDAVSSLREIYLRTYRMIAGGCDIQSALRKYHYRALANWIAPLYPEDFREALIPMEKIGRVICAEYTPQLQLQLLRIDMNALRQPVMDIGCGAHGMLVRHLRSLGVQAFGIDRRIAEKHPFLQETDWFQYKFEAFKWGTVISNLSFTNHFAYALKHDPDRVASFVDKYREIAASLQPRGRLVYAPSAPVLERELDAGQFTLRSWQVQPGFAVTELIKNG